MREDILINAMTDIADDLVLEAQEVHDMKNSSSHILRITLIAAAVMVLLAGAAFAVFHYTRIAERLESDWNETAEGTMTQEKKDFVEERSADLGESVTDQGITVIMESVTCTKDSVKLLYSVILDPERYDLNTIQGCTDALTSVFVESPDYGLVWSSTENSEGDVLENGTVTRQMTCSFSDLPDEAVVNDGSAIIHIEMSTFWMYTEEGKLSDVTGSWGFAFTLPASESVTEKASSETVHFTKVLDLEIYNISVNESAINFCVEPAERAVEPNYIFSNTGEYDEMPDMVTFTVVAYLEDGMAVPTNECSGSYDGVEEWYHIHFVAPVDPAEIVAVVFSDGAEEIKVSLG